MRVNKKLSISLRLLLIAAFLLDASLFAASKRNCYLLFSDLQIQKMGQEHNTESKSFGSPVVIAHAQELEGRWFGDITDWYSGVETDHARRALRKRLDKELAGKAEENDLLDWLKEYPEKYAKTPIKKSVWNKMSPRQQVDYIVGGVPYRNRSINDMVNTEGMSELFWAEIMNYDYLVPTKKKPNYLSIGDDIGSWEIRSVPTTNRRDYQAQREHIEEKMEAMIGHQHIVHDWPENPEVRKQMAGKYVDLLDASTWFLFFRQTKRNPEEMDSDYIFWHQYLGIYPKESLTDLHENVVEGDAENFQDKYRMIGARGYKGMKEMKGQNPNKFYPDFEMRSGNKGIKRNFVEDMLEARISSGDYSGLQDITKTDFDPAMPLDKMTGHRVSEKDLALLKEFERNIQVPKETHNKYIKSDTRNKIFSPLLPWGKRLPLEYKAEILDRAQQRYAEGMVEIAKDYLKRKAKTTKKESLEELWEETQEKIEKLSYQFSDRVQLDNDFERYITPKPAIAKLPSVTVKSKGPVDVNKIDLGIEYSFRFPDKPRNKTAADKMLLETATKLNEAFNGSGVVQDGGDGHGHNVGIKYSFQDDQGRKWRVEWDGISRSYVDGVPTNPRGGHTEIPSPKFAPKDTSEIEVLYAINRELGQDPKRGAGGAHVNVDLEPILKLGPKKGPRKVVDFINFFESSREMTQFLWQHPFRERVAIPVDLHASLVTKLNNFNGTKEELATLLYEEQYFNPYETRKPGYTQLNATPVMDSAVPEKYKGSIDIKNPESKWFPAFAGKGKGRMEFRMFDAMPDEYLAALQIKYVRAMMNKSLNSDGPISLERKYSASDIQKWKDNPKAFVAAAEKHLVELGLDPVEFRPLLAQSHWVQGATPSQKAPLQKYKYFAPAVEASVQ